MRNITQRSKCPEDRSLPEKINRLAGVRLWASYTQNTSFVWKAPRSQNTAFKRKFQPSHGTEDNLGSRHHANMTYTQFL